MDQEQICVNHPDRKATSFCHHCGRYYCSKCLKEGSEFYYCTSPKCLEALEAELHPPVPPKQSPAAIKTSDEAGPETLPENLLYMALYPNLSEASVVKTKLESEGVACFLIEVSCGLIETPYTVPIRLMVKSPDWEKTSQTLKDLKSSGQPEPVDQSITYDEPEDAEAAQAKLSSLGIQSFLCDILSGDNGHFQEAFCLLTRVSDTERATNLLVVPESEQL